MSRQLEPSIGGVHQTSKNPQINDQYLSDLSKNSAAISMHDWSVLH
ncbi:hypothetical protein BIFGAL_02671 [Bifidobacterium gallicum DSM 20093 = LMG 11596]|uniref:Uncharacterized protein n=1 Tax=Bifidobacterium gallicum DSM 20093 = LMG 11596 TaxID=561180 RepID=D1NSB5_9BIFI|nr:hypothetical protein BIFGAL_02671 [Bifidobacterium gallicum DSM 20093 = LMG 11596]